MPQTRQPALPSSVGAGSIDGEFVGHRNVRRRTWLHPSVCLPMILSLGRSKVNEWHFWHGTGAGTV